MSCASYTGGIESTLAQTRGILQARFNFASYKPVIENNPQRIILLQIDKLVKEMGYSGMIL
jgi:hypothetical protein